MAVPAARLIDGKWHFIKKEGKLLEGGEEECDCCPDCCQKILGGTFGPDGKLYYSTTAIDLVITLPNADNRVVCPGERIRLDWTIKSPYNSNGPFLMHSWFDRDWIHVDHGNVSPDLHYGAHWHVWESTSQTTYLELEFTGCFVDFIEQYGDIVVGTDVGLSPSAESIEILCEELPISPGTDCCPWLSECVDCNFLYTYMGDPIGPEVTQEGITYWLEYLDWSLKIVLSGIDPTTKTFGRTTNVRLDIGIRPPKTYYKTYNGSTVDFCFVHLDWDGGGGSQDHPRIPGPDTKQATACYPAPFVEDLGDCPSIARFEYETPAFRYQMETIPFPCYDEDCGDELIPQPLEVKAVVLGAGGGIELILSPDHITCPAPASCCGDCGIGILFAFRGEYDNEIGTNAPTYPMPPPDPAAVYGDPGVATMGIVVVDCTTTQGLHEVYWFVAICENDGELTDDEIATEIAGILSALTGSFVVYEQVPDVTQYLSGLDHINDFCDDPGDCDSIVSCTTVPIDDTSLSCCNLGGEE